MADNDLKSSSSNFSCSFNVRQTPDGLGIMKVEEKIKPPVKAWRSICRIGVLIMRLAQSSATCSAQMIQLTSKGTFAAEY